MNFKLVCSKYGGAIVVTIVNCMCWRQCLDKWRFWLQNFKEYLFNPLMDLADNSSYVNNGVNISFI